ncbi:hypothetical protein ACFSQU_02745 [Massilia sp. GCM10020059]|uniref:Uncharacterized protein n=1 Tax=Massilia agrisoli TaxID=2892444 RepID=A0ABS8IRC2_9BURK|nr:hypothetical protein [Massilia agrisoli]MCC6069835.1 hypothetical protein [Massilia agrisoli]
MTTATFHANDSLRDYFADVARAARAFAAALFAAQERQYVAQEVVQPDLSSARAMQKSRMQLFAMARDCENISPSLAAELRNLAGRG